MSSFSITTLSKKGLYLTLSISDSWHKRQSAIMLSVIMLSATLHRLLRRMPLCWVSLYWMLLWRMSWLPSIFHKNLRNEKCCSLIFTKNLVSLCKLAIFKICQIKWKHSEYCYLAKCYPTRQLRIIFYIDLFVHSSEWPDITLLPLSVFYYIDQRFGLLKIFLDSNFCHFLSPGACTINLYYTILYYYKTVL